MRNFLLLSVFIMLFICHGCSAPPEPPEIRYVELQKRELLKAGVLEYAPDKYGNYLIGYKDATNAYFKENERFRYLRNYDAVGELFRSVLVEGNKILGTIIEKKEERSRDIEKQISSLNDRIASIRRSTSMINEGRLIRKSLSRAEILLKEADLLNKNRDYVAAEFKLKRVNTYSLQSLDVAYSILNRYMDKQQIAKWRKLVEATIAESRNHKIVVFIVSKIDQSLMVYKNGNLTKTYNVGLGRNGLKDKLYAGDGGTPEGRYYIVKKNAASRYYKALLFDYPNDEDRIRFNSAKRKGQIPARTGIGSLVEIHGGGSDGMTRGCISLENSDMDKIFAIANIGTPVTIVGAINGTHEILSPIKEKSNGSNF